MENNTVYPPPLPSPVFKLTQDDWDALENELRPKQEPRPENKKIKEGNQDAAPHISYDTRRYIIYHCNYYIIQICRFHENNNKARAFEKIKKKFDDADDLVVFLDTIRHLRNEGYCPGATPDDEASQKAARVIRHSTTTYTIEADSILDEEYARAHGLSPEGYVTRSAQRAYRNYMKFEEAVQLIKDALGSLRSHFDEQSKNIEISPNFHGDPFIDELTMRLWIAYRKSGGNGKYTPEATRFIDFIYTKMWNYYFQYFSRNVSASISPPQENVSKNRLKRATTSIPSSKIEALDNISLFGLTQASGPENVRTALFRVGLIELL